MVWLKRLFFVLAVSCVGYFLVLHAAMSSDQDSTLAWYYALEFIVAGVLCWPVSIYLGLTRFIGGFSNVLGLEVWLVQILGYAIAFYGYDKYKSHIQR